MTRLELVKMTTEELRNLNRMIIEEINIRKDDAIHANKGKLVRGMICDYIGNSKNIKYNSFEILKINRTKAQCKCLTTNSNWDISLANLEPTGKLSETAHSIIDKTEKQPNNKKQW